MSPLDVSWVRHLIKSDEFLGVATDSCCLIHVYCGWLFVVLWSVDVGVSREPVISIILVFT